MVLAIITKLFFKHMNVKLIGKRQNWSEFIPKNIIDLNFHENLL